MIIASLKGFFEGDIGLQDVIFTFFNKSNEKKFMKKTQPYLRHFVTVFLQINKLFSNLGISALEDNQVALHPHIFALLVITARVQMLTRYLVRTAPTKM